MKLEEIYFVYSYPFPPPITRSVSFPPFPITGKSESISKITDGCDEDIGIYREECVKIFKYGSSSKVGREWKISSRWGDHTNDGFAKKIQQLWRFS